MKTRLEQRIISSEQAGRLIKNNWTVGLLSPEPCSFPSTICKALERRFVSEGEPRELTLLFNIGYGEIKGDGIDRFGHRGMVKKLIGADYSFASKINRLITKNNLQAYSFPSAVMSEMFRSLADGGPGVISKIGIGSFVDPRHQGGRLNLCSEETMVENVVFQDGEWLFYKPIALDVVIIRAEAVNQKGDLFFRSWSAKNEALYLAAGARRNKGLVIAEVKEIVDEGEQGLLLPSFLVDYIVVDKGHEDSNKIFNPTYSAGTSREWEVIAGRVAREIEMDSNVFIEKRLKNLAWKLVSGGKDFNLITDWFDSQVLQSGSRGNVSLNCLSSFSVSGLLDLAILPFNQIDGEGNVNVSKSGHRIVGCGRFPELCQNSKKLVFCGVFTADGCSIALQGGKLSIIKDGRSNRFVSRVEQIAFNSEIALRQGLEVIYITERAVFKLNDEGLVLTEIAPGVNLWRDVLNKMGCEVVISPQLKLMDARLLLAEKDGAVLGELG